MSKGSRANSGEGHAARVSFSDAPTRMGLPFAGPDADPSAVSARTVASERGAEVIPLGRHPDEPTALLSASHRVNVAAQAKPANRRRRRDRRTDNHRAMSRPEDRVGQVLSGTYRIEKLIAVGGMGAVYEVAHMRLSQRFAVKFLDRGLSTDAEAYARFRQEAEIAAQVNHDNVVQVFDFNTDESGSPYMVMELVNGKTLDRYMKEEAPLGRDEVLAIFSPLCRALEACHARGIVHRDLKPSNIIVCPQRDGQINLKLLDFGISKIKQEGGAGDMTRENVVMGTPNYMSPEQASGQNKTVDARADIFALGAILYELLCGEKAFDADGLPQLLHKIVYEEPEPLTNHGVPPKVAEVVGEALAKEPEDRLVSVGELLDALHSAYKSRVERFSGAPGAGSRSGLGVGAWLAMLSLSVAVASAVTYFVAVPAAAQRPAPVEARAEATEESTPTPSLPLVPDRFRPKDLAGKAGAYFIESAGRLYRADQSSLSFWADANAEPVTGVLPSAAQVSSMSLSTDRRELMVGQADGWVTRWDHALKKEPERQRFGNKDISALASGNGYLAVGTSGTVRLLSEKTGKTLKVFKTGDDATELLLTPGQETKLLIFRGDELEVIDADKRRSLTRIPLGGAVLRAGFADQTTNKETCFWIDQVQGDWTVRRTFELEQKTKKQPPRIKPVGDPERPPS